MRRLGEELERGSSATVLVRMVGDPRMDGADVAQVLRLAREALSNVARHAAATHVEVSVHAFDDRVEVRITDDGRGFDPAATPRPGHHGLHNMRARALELGATLELESEVGTGTTVRLSVPLREVRDR
jgi:signal transduction histidine kinase